MKAKHRERPSSCASLLVGHAVARRSTDHLAFHRELLVGEEEAEGKDVGGTGRLRKEGCICPSAPACPDERPLRR